MLHSFYQEQIFVGNEGVGPENALDEIEEQIEVIHKKDGYDNFLALNTIGYNLLDKVNIE